MKSLLERAGRCFGRTKVLLLLSMLMVYVVTIYIFTTRSGQTKALPPLPKFGEAIGEKLSVKGNNKMLSPTFSLECVFPKQDPFDPLIMKHFKKEPDINCNKGLPSLVYVKGNFLVLNTTKAKLLNVTLDRCSYMTLTLHSSSDLRLKQSAWSKSFTESIEIQNWYENIVAKCYSGPKLVSSSYLARIIKKDLTEKICEEKYKRHIEKNSPKETLSVALIGIDGTSRQNAIRSMPETVNFLLNDMGALDLRKFNKVGDNTFVNIVPLMAGIHEKELLARNWTYRMPFDKVDHLFLWGPYKDAGYRTGMLVDHKWITAFHYLKKGWVNPPFDYYHRPIVLEIDKDHAAHGECVGDTPQPTLLLDYWLQLFTTFNNTKTTPYFVYNFIVKLTHNDANKATQADKIYSEFFRTVAKRNVLNNTVLVFFSDHGCRYGSIRHSPPGALESNTPFVFFIFPKWFQAKYPDVMSTLRTNQDRLTTQFDVHATLMDLLYFKGTTGKGNLQSRGISLFQEIPEDRLCEHAGIPYQYCMCSKQMAVPIYNTLKQMAVPISNTLKRKLGRTLLEHIVNKTSKYRDLCVIFNFASYSSLTSILGDGKCELCLYFQMAIVVFPGAVFEASLQHDRSSGTTTVLGDAMRITKYGHQADCIYDPKLRQYCFCANTP